MSNMGFKVNRPASSRRGAAVVSASLGDVIVSDAGRPIRRRAKPKRKGAMGGAAPKRRRRRGSVGNGEAHAENGNNKPHMFDVGKLQADVRKSYEIMPPRSQAQVEMMALIVTSLARQVNWLGHARLGVKRGEAGLHEWDHDLAGLQARVRVYLSHFIKDESEALRVRGPDVSAWTDEDWATYETSVEGPVLYWSGQDWRDADWGLAAFDGPKGHRPDMTEVWTLANQIMEVREHEIELVTSFWGFIHSGAEQLAADFGDVFDGVVEFAKEKIEQAADYVVEVAKKHPFKFGGAVLFGGLALGAFVLWKFGGRRR